MADLLDERTPVATPSADRDKRRLLILHDSLAFGGHELMFLRLFPLLLGSPRFDEICFVFPNGNERLATSLRAIESPKLRLMLWHFHKKGGEPYRGPFRFAYRHAVRKLAAGLRPSAVLLLQGRIENCVVPMLALPADQFIVSYIPMAHKLSEMGRSGMGDVIRRRLYARPQRYIVPSSAVADQLLRAGGRATPIVIENQVSPPPPPPKPVAREQLDLPQERNIALFLGRLDVGQKGLDLLRDAVLRAADRLGDWTFIFVGDGEGRALVDGIAAAASTPLDIRCHDWTDQPHRFLAAADVLLMPSRWEGVPLVMLEAIDYGTPILASRIDVYREYLPDYCHLDFATGDLAAALDRLVSPRIRADFQRSIAERKPVDAEDRAARFLGAFEPGASINP